MNQKPNEFGIHALMLISTNDIAFHFSAISYSVEFITLLLEKMSIILINLYQNTFLYISAVYNNVVTRNFFFEGGHALTALGNICIHI